MHASSITLVHTETKEVEVLDIEQGSYSKPASNITIEGNAEGTLETSLYVKQQFGLYNAAYHELSMVSKSFSLLENEGPCKATEFYLGNQTISRLLCSAAVT